MLVYLAEWLTQWHSGFRVFSYLSMRAIAGSLTALLICLIWGPWMIRWLTRYQIGQTMQEEVTHHQKGGTPTMGGVLILMAIAISVLLWARLDNALVWIVLLTTLAFGAIGFADDYLKIVRKHNFGLSAKQKLLAQVVVAGLAACAFLSVANAPAETALLLPFFKAFSLPLGGLFVIFVLLVVVGSSNAVNLTDGLDGLAIMPAVLVGGALGVFAYLTGHAEYSTYLAIPHISATSELVVVSAALVGAGLGFLWFNTYPAQMFMGDVGSLALGALLGSLAVAVRQEIVLLIMGGVFVMETVSVILQVASFKLTGKRIFKMAPIHHHFELKGWPEPKVIVRFWIITFILVLIGLATLKVR